MITREDNEVKEVQGFQCTDLEIFEDREKAEKHQHELDRNRAIDCLVEDKCWNGMDTDEIKDFLSENREDVLAALR